MKVIYGYAWGIWWWRTCAVDTRVADMVCDLDSMEDRTGDMGVLKLAGVDGTISDGQERGIPAEVPIEVVVPRGETHRSTKRVVRRPSSIQAPPGSLCKIGHGQYVFVPEVCLYQVASIVSTLFKRKVEERLLVVIVVRLGVELCGSYSLADTKRKFIDRQPLASVASILYVAFELRGSRGINRLWEALPWIVEGSASPKETDLYLLLCLPARLGGFGLPRPWLNFHIDVSQVREGYFARRSECIVDLYWPQAHLVVEYDSKTFHEDMGEGKVQADLDRAKALEALGYHVVSITPGALYDDKRLTEKAQEIASWLGRELPQRSEEFLEIHRKLVDMLLRHDRWV